MAYLRPIALLPMEFLLESRLSLLMTVQYRNMKRINMTTADAMKILNSMVPHNSHHDLSCQPVEWCARWLQSTANTGTPVKCIKILIYNRGPWATILQQRERGKEINQGLPTFTVQAEITGKFLGNICHCHWYNKIQWVQKWTTQWSS